MKKKTVIIAAAVVVISACSIAAYLVYIYKVVNNYSSRIYPGVNVENTDLSGKTTAEAEALLQKKYGNTILNKKINIDVNGKKYSVDYASLNAKYNIGQIVNQAERYGKGLNAFQKYNLIKNTVNKTYKLKLSYNPEYIDKITKTIEKDNNKPPTNASLKIAENGNIIIIPDVKGAKVSADVLKKDIYSRISGELTSNTEIKAEIKDVHADITSDSLKSINAKISSYSTSYINSTEERCYNISLATSRINGSIIMPDKIFSFNNVVGEISAAKGFKPASVIIENKVQEGIGGGVCQVSSTIYNAVLRADINSTERTHHAFPSVYVPLGMDATVNYPGVDYKFKNTLGYPIFIEGYTYDKNVHFNIYSNSSLKDKTYDIVNEIYETTAPQVQYNDDPALPAGQTEEVQSPHAGCKVKVYRNTYQYGNIINHELISNDIYNVFNQIIKRGTKK